MMLSSSAVDREFESRYQIKPLSMQHYGERAKIRWLGSRIMCPSGATCISSHCWSSTKQTSSSSHWKLTCSRHDIAEN